MVAIKQNFYVQAPAATNILSNAANMVGPADGTMTTDTGDLSFTYDQTAGDYFGSYTEAFTGEQVIYVSCATSAGPNPATVPNLAVKMLGTGNSAWVPFANELATTLSATSAVRARCRFTAENYPGFAGIAAVGIEISSSGGSPSGRETVQVDAYRWEATYDRVMLGTPLKYWDGNQWVTGRLKRWDGSQWVLESFQRWDGSQWVFEE